MSGLTPLLTHVCFGNPLSDWLLAALVFLLTFTVLPVVRRILRAQRRRHAGAEWSPAVALAAHLMEHTSRVVLWTLALYGAERILSLPARVDRLFSIAIVLGVWLQVGIWAMAAVQFWLQPSGQAPHDARLAGSLSILRFAARLVIWGIVLLLVLDNLGINITALIAGLGVGGIAIALAVQTILGDLFASLSIALDKPFEIGDRLRVADCEGTVERIGIKSTRLRSVSGEQIILSNTDLLKSRVHNFGRMPEQRALCSLRLNYRTPPEQLDALAALVQAAVSVVPGTRFGGCLLREFGESALRYEVWFFVDLRVTPDFDAAVDRIHRDMLRRLADGGIEFAYPTRTVLMPAPPDP